MNRPYVICHMTMSLDGKVTGDFLAAPVCAPATDLYYQIHRDCKAGGFACGRVTMEGSFTGGWYPDLSAYAPTEDPSDWLGQVRSGFCAVAFDPHGRLGWQGSRIQDPDGDPGYDKAQIVEILTRQADPRYLTFLREKGIPYLFAGDNQMDVPEALKKLKTHFGMETLLLEGGSILDGAFQRAGVIDELSLVVAPVVSGAEGKPLFTESILDHYRLAAVENHNGILWLNYKRMA